MKEQFETVACNLCGNDNYQKISQSGQFGLVTNVVLCKDCGLGYLNPRWTKETYLDFYINRYDKYYRPNINNTKTDLNKKNPIFERLHQRNLLKQNSIKVLDVGSGAGDNLNFFKSKLPTSEFYAIEPSDNAEKILNSNDITVISKDVDSDWNKDYKETFDLIIMRHVLEHFSDPVDALKRIESSLSKDGLLYIAVPNNNKPTTPLLSNWFRVVHTYYFNKISLTEILYKSNLSPIELVEGDHFNQGELYTFVKKRSDLPFQEKEITNTYSDQLAIFQNKLNAEKKLIPSFKRTVKFFNQKVRRTLKS